MARIPEGFDELPLQEKIQLVQDLWDRIADEAAAEPLTPEQGEELDRREAEHDRDPASAIPLDEALRQLKRPT